MAPTQTRTLGRLSSGRVNVSREMRVKLEKMLPGYAELCQKKYYGIFDTKVDAEEMANMIRYHGSYARIQKYKGQWIVWEGEKY